MGNGQEIIMHDGTGALSHYQPEAVELSVDEIVHKIEKVRDVAARVMKEDIHFGTIPGTQKPTLYKAGAEILGLTFMMAPKYEGERQPIDLGNGHREYIIRCDMYHKVTEKFLGSGVGSCSTMESKYRFRPGPVTSTGKPVPKEYWDCRKSDPKRAQELLGGKGYSTKKIDGNWEIVQAGEVVENPNIADTYNSVLKIGSKRAYIDATLKATAASEVYTQDLEDMKDNDEVLQGTVAAESSAASPIQQPQRKSETQPSNGDGPSCPTCKGKMHLVPEGITKTGKNAGKTHAAFWGCETKDCKGFMWDKDYKPAQKPLIETYGTGADPDPLFGRIPGEEG